MTTETAKHFVFCRLDLMSSMRPLIKELQNTGVLKNTALLSAFKAIDRADFVPADRKLEAYQNYPLPIGHGQTISQPYTVAFMMGLLDPKPEQKILEIGSGSGWQTAMLAHIVGAKGKIYAMEIIPELKKIGEANVAKYPALAKHVVFFAQSAENGLPEHAPFDRIIAAASLQEIPDTWKAQLAVGGKMVFPLRESIYVLTKEPAAKFHKEIFPGFVFVPFVK